MTRHRVEGVEALRRKCRNCRLDVPVNSRRQARMCNPCVRRYVPDGTRLCRCGRPLPENAHANRKLCDECMYAGR